MSLLNRVDFDLALVPDGNPHVAVDVLDTYATSRVERIALMKFFGEHVTLRFCCVLTNVGAGRETGLRVLEVRHGSAIARNAQKSYHQDRNGQCCSFHFSAWSFQSVGIA